MVSEQLQSMGVSRLDGIMEKFNKNHELMISMLTKMIEAKSASKYQSNHNNHPTLLSEPKFPTPSSSPDIDVISIHKHSNSSLLFQFGDPSEITENVKLMEPRILKGIKEESQEGFSMEKVFDGDIERQVIVKKLDKEVRNASSTEMTNEGNGSTSVVETESKSSEKLSENSNNVELTVQISSIVTKESSGCSGDLESVGYGEECSSEKNMDEISPLVSVTVLDESSKVDNGSAMMESAEEKIGGDMMLQSIHLKPDHVNDIIDDIVNEDIIRKTIAAINVSANNQSMEIGTRIETVENGKGNERNALTPVSPQLERSMSLFLDIENQNSEIGMPANITKDGITGDMNVAATFPFTEAAVEFSLDSKDQNSEATIDSSEDSKDQKEGIKNGMPRNTVEDGSQSDMIELNNSQKTFLEPMRIDDDHSVINNDFIEASACEVIVLKFVESVARRIKADFVLSSGAALLPHLSKVLIGGEDAYFISGQTWLSEDDIDYIEIIASEEWRDFLLLYPHEAADFCITALHMVALNVYFDCVQLLLDLHANVSAVTFHYGTSVDMIGHGSTHLHYLLNPRMVKRMKGC